MREWACKDKEHDRKKIPEQGGALGLILDSPLSLRKEGEKNRIPRGGRSADKDQQSRDHEA